MAENRNAKYGRNNTSGFLLGILFFSAFFSFGVNEAEAAPIKILSNSSTHTARS